MTSLRQLLANRRNATRSTGPRTAAGRLQSRRNALRHGLCAETVIETLEDVADYKAFEAAITADYDVQTAVERELVLRLASLLWRLRRATAIETDLLRIQAEILVGGPGGSSLGTATAVRWPSDVLSSRPLRNTADPHCDAHDEAVDPGTDGDRMIPAAGSPSAAARELTYCFQRLAQRDNGLFDRLGRYDSRLWRQLIQTLFALHAIKRRIF